MPNETLYFSKFLNFFIAWFSFDFPDTEQIWSLNIILSDKLSQLSIKKKDLMLFDYTNVIYQNQPCFDFELDK